MPVTGIENDDEDIDEIENDGTELESKNPPDQVVVVEDDDEATAKVDTELEEAENDEEREKIKALRAGRKTRTQRNRERVDALERTLQSVQAQNQTLQQQVSSIQDVNTGSQLAQIDNAIAQANQAADHFKSVIATAASNNDGKTIAEATEYMIAARARAKELSDFKQNATRAMNAPKPLNPDMVEKSKAFLGKNTWYGGPTSNDQDSKILTVIDNSLTAENWDPSTDAYWAELERRKIKYLPHRVAKPQARAGGSPVPGGNQSSNTSGKNVFHLSKAQIENMQMAGLWDDPEKRKSMIDQYRKYAEKTKG